MKRLDAGEIEQTLKNAPGWTLVDSKLQREWTFSDFVDAMTFVNRIAAIAEAAGHHPDIDIRYNRVKLELVTHDVGGITVKSAEMAARLSQDL